MLCPWKRMVGKGKLLGGTLLRIKHLVQYETFSLNLPLITLARKQKQYPCSSLSSKDASRDNLRRRTKRTTINNNMRIQIVSMRNNISRTGQKYECRLIFMVVTNFRSAIFSNQKQIQVGTMQLLFIFLCCIRQRKKYPTSSVAVSSNIKQTPFIYHFK